jgi:hypothetical protein
MEILLYNYYSFYLLLSSLQLDINSLLSAGQITAIAVMSYEIKDLRKAITRIENTCFFNKDRRKNEK